VLKAQIGDAWSACQDSRYAGATRLPPPVIEAARNAVSGRTGEDEATAHGLLAMAYQGAAMVLTKVGESDLAWLAADRGLSAANQSDNLLISGSLYRSVAHCLLATAQFDARRLDASVGVVNNAATFFAAATDDSNPSHLSIYGTLHLVSSMAAARAGDRTTANKYLAEAEKAAQRLGYDGNHWWTSFGPTTVAMHRVSAALELGDVDSALARGSRLDTSSLPIERRVRHKLDLARAHLECGHREEAVDLLLDADELAPEQVGSHYIARSLVTAWIKMGREGASRSVADLAQRLQIV
jgi:tetratricopeptide (TPR) repeat protein